ncbi:cobalt ECF transporter T component CbiQ [Calderihabitans maritimus]|uniref:Cobalt ABC transporter permease n=1 Tax=Calderihabitans maritimus TaxID=1246530 RepID=A0A1Z5HVN6_9FIRM|nr:cobalt ECF transporter T component CbiQ [Calderihabitans maritimus]GAW93468.1 cobalt ABC transporter permease [Calderihabitans maritimus]
MFKIDQYAYANKLLSVHPGEKFAFALITMAVGLIFDTINTSMIIIIMMSGATIILAGVRWRLYVKLLSLPLGFLIAGVAAIAVSFSYHDVDVVSGFTVGRFLVGVQPGDLYLALRLFFKALGAVSCLYFLALTTPMTDIIIILRKLKAPPLFVELMSLIYRFIFVLLETAGRIHLSQASRCGYFSFASTYRSLGALLSNLFIRTYWRSRISFTALLSRGYTGSINVLEPRYSVSYKNILAIAAVEALLIVLGLHGRGII